MSDPLGLDSHKLHLHPGRVHEWAEGEADWERAKKVYPIYVEVSPSGACNHRCTFCALDYLGYEPAFLDAAVAMERLSELASAGTRSVMFAGEGEPLLHPRLGELVACAREAGLDCSLTTNAVPLTERFLDEALGSLAWIKASINAGTRETYARIHRADPKDFDRALENMARASRLKRERGYRVALGAQMVLLPENAAEAETLARRTKEAGLDYLALKPYSQHRSSVTRAYEAVRYSSLDGLAERLQALEGDGFHVAYRDRAMRKSDDPEPPPYGRCQATPFFWAYVMAKGDVYGCSAFLGDERFLFGNWNERSFEDIWEGPQRQGNWRLVREELEIAECRRNCRMDEANRYLWAVKHPPEHVNFI